MGDTRAGAFSFLRKARLADESFTGGTGDAFSASAIKR
jgi:hypothetical protein